MAEDLVTLVDPPVFVTHDETAGLQNSTETPSPPNPAGDADDDDVLFASIPGVFSTRLGELTSATPIGAAESPGNVVTFNPTGTLGNIALTDADGNPLDGDDSGLVTTDGDAILLYTDENDNIVLGKTADDTLVFAIYLEETGGSPPTGAKLWTVQYLAIDHGDDGNDPDSAVDLTGLVHVTAFEEQDFSFANAPAGQNLFMMFGNASQAILVTGEDPANESEAENVSNDGDSVNTGQGGGATTLGTEGQQIKAQKALVVTFVSGKRAAPELRVLTEGASPIPDRAFELWALPGAGAAPVSLGLLPAQGEAVLTLSPQVRPLLERGAALAVSVEPPGGSPTGQPTGPVVYQGKLTTI